MNVSINVPDQMMAVNSRWLKVSMIGIDTNLVAVQWAGDSGTEEWVGGSNTTFTDPRKYKVLLDRWDAQSSIEDAPRTPEEIADEESRAARSALIEAAKVASGLLALTPSTAINYINSIFNGAVTTDPITSIADQRALNIQQAALNEKIRICLIKMVVHFLKKEIK